MKLRYSEIYLKKKKERKRYLSERIEGDKLGFTELGSWDLVETCWRRNHFHWLVRSANSLVCVV